MDDLISRQTLLEEKFAYIECMLQENKDKHYDIYKKGWNDAIDAIYKNAPSAQQWIPCSEITEEEENEFYLATIYSREMQTAFCDILFYGAPQLCGDSKIGWYFLHNGGMEQVFNVTAWMPLPKPYKGAEE